MHAYFPVPWLFFLPLRFCRSGLRKRPQQPKPRLLSKPARFYFTKKDALTATARVASAARRDHPWPICAKTSYGRRPRSPARFSMAGRRCPHSANRSPMRRPRSWSPTCARNTGPFHPQRTPRVTDPIQPDALTQPSISAAISARTASGNSGIAPCCEAIHEPQRLPASLSRARSAPRSR